MTIKNEAPLKAGEVVTLVSGGPKMAVEAPFETVDGTVTKWVCTWCPRVDHGDGWGADMQEGEFVTATLVRVDEDTRAHDAYLDACTERDMLAARMKEVEAERDALRCGALRLASAIRIGEAKEVNAACEALCKAVA